MPEVTLLPCPACGNPDAVVSVTTRAAVYCPMCGMCGPCSPKVDAESLGTSTKMEPSISLCRLTAYPIKILVANGAPSPNPANRRNSHGSSRNHAHRDRDRLPSRNRGAFRDALGVHPRVSAGGYIPVYRTGRADNGTTRDKSYGSCRMRPRRQARTEVAPIWGFSFFWRRTCEDPPTP